MPRLTAAQLAGRKLGMGASCVVEALGLSPYEGAGPMRLFLAKTEPDVVDDDGAEPKDWLEWGHTMEPVILADYVRQTRYGVIPGGEVRSREYPWLWATLDATVLGEDRNVEVKNVSSSMAWHWDAYAEDGVPRYVRAQCIIGMHCTGKRLCDVVASVGGRAPHIWTVAWDDELATLLLKGACDFWARVGLREPPPLDATPATKEYLRRRYPSNVDRVIVDATEHQNYVAKCRIMSAQREREAKEAKDLADVELLRSVGTNDGLQGDGWKMTWKIGKDGVRRQRFTDQGEE